MSTLDKRISELPAVDIGTLTGTEQFEIIWFNGSSWVNESMTLEELFTIMTAAAGVVPTGSAYQVLQLESDGSTPVFLNYLYDLYGIQSLDYFNRNLLNSTGGVVLNYSNAFVEISSIMGEGYRPSTTLFGTSGIGCGLSLADGSNNIAGQITLHTGTGVGIGTYLALGWFTSFPNNSFVSLTPANSVTAALYGSNQVYPATSGSSLVIVSGAAPLADSSTYSWFYTVVGG